MSFSIQILKTGGLVVLTGGTIVASILGGNWLTDIVSKRLCKLDDTGESKADEQDDTPYEYKFIDEYQQRYQEMVEKDQDDTSTDTDDVKKQLEAKLNGTKIHEITPKGDVIMYYDTELESFVYYCDDKNIPYKYLETVARKYSLDNDCLEIFVNMYDELKKGIERQKDAKIQKCIEDAKKKKNTKESKQESNSVFASFKQYNKTDPKEIIKQRRYITKENANRYSYRGNIETGRQLRIENPKKKGLFKNNKQDHLTQSVNTTTAHKGNQPSNHNKLSFSDFKRMQTSTSVESLPVKTIEEWAEGDNEVSTQNIKEQDDSPSFSPSQKKPDRKQYNNTNLVEDADNVENGHVNEAYEVTMNEQELADLLDQ